jgi:hypothetical protein
MEKELLPFRFWGIESFQHEVNFLSADKSAIKDFNERVTKEFNCVKSGDCNGRMDFQNKAEEYFGVSFEDELLDGIAFLSSLESVFRKVFQMYGLPFDADAYFKQDERDFGASIFRKCTCIAIDVFYGSLMCNYYSPEFSTYNNYQDSVGYEVYDPLEYGDGLNIKSPLSIYQSKVEKMGNLLLNELDLSRSKDEHWWSDLIHTKNNILGNGKWLNEHKVLMHHTNTKLNSTAWSVHYYLFPININFAFGWLVQTVEYIHKRTLTRTIFTKNRVYLALSNFQVDMVVGSKIAKLLNNFFHLYCICSILLN